MDKKKIHVSDKILTVAIFIVVLALVVVGIHSYHNKKELQTSLTTLEQQLEVANEKNRVHEKEEIKTGVIENHFNATGQIRIEVGKYITTDAKGGLVVEDTSGARWTLNSVSVTGIDSDDELLLFIDNGNTPQNSADDTVVGVYINAEVYSSR